MSQIVEGYLVLLSTRNLRLKYPHAKLLTKFLGPFEVFKQPENSHKNPNSVWLKTPKTGGPSDIDVSLPVTVDCYDMWEIQSLLTMRTDKKSPCKQALVL